MNCDKKLNSGLVLISLILFGLIINIIKLDRVESKVNYISNSVESTHFMIQHGKLEEVCSE